MIRILLVDDDEDHAFQLNRFLAQRGCLTTRAEPNLNAIDLLRNAVPGWDLVILVLTDRLRPWLRILYNLQQAAAQDKLFQKPLFLCVSRLRWTFEFELQIEQMGARYACED